MSHQPKQHFEGVVVEALPNAMYRVKTDEGAGVLTTISGRLRPYCIKVLPGDRVTIELSPNDPSRGRITSRHE